jgi:NAD(P)-dependent dehydrogenase (short-subunit alcohol dehydrogenase family)
MASLTNKVAIITGAGGGLGKVIAEEFLKAGAKVTIVDINDERLKSVEAELSKLGEVLTVNCNVTDEAAVTKLFEETKAKFGGVDILVNNAGLMDVFDPVGTLEKDRWDRVLAVNLTAPFLLSKAAVNEFLSKDPHSGVILNIASQGGLRGFRAGLFHQFLVN